MHVTKMSLKFKTESPQIRFNLAYQAYANGDALPWMVTGTYDIATPGVVGSILAKPKLRHSKCSSWHNSGILGHAGISFLAHQQRISRGTTLDFEICFGFLKILE